MTEEQIVQAQNSAANDLIEALVAKVGGPNREVVPVEVISTSARLAGSLLFRSFNFSLPDLQPGNVVLSEEANTEGPKLINVTGGMLQNMGVNMDQSMMQSGTNHKPDLEFVDAMRLIQKDAVDIMNKLGLSYVQMAQSAAMSTAFLIHQCQGQLSIPNGFNTAVYFYIEGTKTFPPPLDDTTPPPAVPKPAPHHPPASATQAAPATTPSQKKPWWKFW
ncbi:MAG TPA: hypothetical protein DCR93_26415 [Cytophagales bacterium]|nr:hypothetical protein [Cytophagales bacterium]HAP62879.1 hypothetical protein [Cytophagales bacterium]